MQTQVMAMTQKQDWWIWNKEGHQFKSQLWSSHKLSGHQSHLSPEGSGPGKVASSSCSVIHVLYHVGMYFSLRLIFLPYPPCGITNGSSGLRVNGWQCNSHIMWPCPRHFPLSLSFQICKTDANNTLLPHLPRLLWGKGFVAPSSRDLGARRFMRLFMFTDLKMRVMLALNLQVTTNTTPNEFQRRE